MSTCSKGELGRVRIGFMLVIAGRAIYCLLGRKCKTDAFFAGAAPQAI